MLEFWNKEAIALASIFPWILKEVLKNPASFRVSEVCTLIQTSKPLDKSKCSSNETSIFYETSSLKPVTEIFFQYLRMQAVFSPLPLPAAVGPSCSTLPYTSLSLPLTCSLGSLLLPPPLYLPLPPPHLQPRIPLAPPSVALVSVATRAAVLAAVVLTTAKTKIINPHYFKDSHTVKKKICLMKSFWQSKSSSLDFKWALKVLRS